MYTAIFAFLGFGTVFDTRWTVYQVLEQDDNGYSTTPCGNLRKLQCVGIQVQGCSVAFPDMKWHILGIEVLHHGTRGLVHEFLSQTKSAMWPLNSLRIEYKSTHKHGKPELCKTWARQTSCWLEIKEIFTKGTWGILNWTHVFELDSCLSWTHVFAVREVGNNLPAKWYDHAVQSLLGLPPWQENQEIPLTFSYYNAGSFHSWLKLTATSGAWSMTLLKQNALWMCVLHDGHSLHLVLLRTRWNKIIAPATSLIIMLFYSDTHWKYEPPSSQDM